MRDLRVGLERRRQGRGGEQELGPGRNLPGPYTPRGNHPTDSKCDGYLARARYRMHRSCYLCRRLGFGLFLGLGLCFGLLLMPVPRLLPLLGSLLLLDV